MAREVLTPAKVRRLARGGALEPTGPVGRIAIWFARCGLSLREEQVAWQVIAGCSNREIAERLFIEEQTVKNELTVVYRKCGIEAGGIAVGRNVRRTRLLARARAIGAGEAACRVGG